MNLPHSPESEDITFSLDPLDGIPKKLQRIRRRYDEDFTDIQKLFTAVLKSSLMAADLAGSALPTHGKEVDIWLRDHLSAVLQEHQLSRLAHEKLRGSPLRAFQKELEQRAPHTALLEAGCGTGKTIGAYLWAGRKANGRRLFFCYPTTATASEGFSGYMKDPEFEALLVHSRASIDYRLLENMPPGTASEEELRLLRLEALDTWPVPAVVCTAHTVLGLLQNVRRSLYAWPGLARSAFVFDEVHAFPEKLFKHLLRFLETFPSNPVLLMTATLPPERKRALEEACRKRRGLEVVTGPRKREEAKRYILESCEEERAWEEAEAVLGRGGKVLWISNTVDRAISRTQRALESSLAVAPFHSRYRYKDRLVRQRSLVDGFAPGRPAMLGMTTQVAEVSLDLSADLLVTEYAPVPSLIQRLGRLNRYEEEPKEIRKALLIKPESALPYAARKEDEESFYRQVQAWLDQVADGAPKSQKELGAAFLGIESEETGLSSRDLFCDWLDEPWSSLNNRHALMEGGYTMEVVREEDFEITSNHVWLNSDGRRKAIQVYETRRQEKWKHPVLCYSLSYARTIELEARLLEKEWAGEPGLFAKLRLR